MIKAVEEMSEETWRLYVATRFDRIDERQEKMQAFQRWQLRTWVAMASAIGFYLLPRFIDFVMTGLTP